MEPRPVFVSAGLPPGFPGRDSSSLPLVFRELVRAVLINHSLVSEGKPFSAPLLVHMAEVLGAGAKVFVYQSAMYRGNFPAEAREPPGGYRLVWTPAVLRTPPDLEDPFDRERSRALLREWMIVRRCLTADEPPLPPFAAAFFLGGGRELESDWSLFTECYPAALAIPVGAFGGAASEILRSLEGDPHLPPDLYEFLSGGRNHVCRCFREILERYLPAG